MTSGIQKPPTEPGRTQLPCTQARNALNHVCIEEVAGRLTQVPHSHMYRPRNPPKLWLPMGPLTASGQMDEIFIWVQIQYYLHQWQTKHSGQCTFQAPWLCQQSQLTDCCLGSFHHSVTPKANYQDQKQVSSRPVVFRTAWWSEECWILSWTSC